jgi:hypothetical protein
MASGIRNGPAMSRTRLAAAEASNPAAVTYRGRLDCPRVTGTAWVAVRNGVFATPTTGTPNSVWT